MVKKALKKSKNYILHARLGYMGKIYIKKIVSMVDDIDGNPTKICFYNSCISIKIMQNLSTKPISEVSTKLDRVHVDLWGPSSNIFLKENRYRWTAID